MKYHISFKLLRLSLGIFFVVLGIVGILPNVQESVFTLNDKLPVEIIFGIVEITCGLLLISGLFTFMKRKTVSRASLIVLIIWGIRIVLTNFIWRLTISNKGIFFKPAFSTWILVLCCELVIGAAIFVVYKAYD